MNAKYNGQQKNNKNTMDSYGMDIVGSNGPVKRIRTPHSHDVLSGRGGGINSHDGNKTFREWVRQRKNKYNLAGSKVEKAQVAKEVINRVKSLKPPGRFLQRENASNSGSGGWWVELDETKSMAKTSQALREGAPQIRAAHKDEIEEILTKKTKAGRKRRQQETTAVAAAVIPKLAVPKNTVTPPTPKSSFLVKQTNVYTSTSPPPPLSSSQPPLTSPLLPLTSQLPPLTSSAALDNSRIQKRQRIDVTSTSNITKSPQPTEIDFHAATPPLVPQAAPGVPSLAEDISDFQKKYDCGLKRSNSLALSDINADWNFNNYDFVNPFEYDSDYEEEQLGVFGGAPKETQRTVSSSSMRSFTSDFSDLPDPRGNQDTEFGEGMKMVYDAAHPGLTSPTTTDDKIPTHLYPYKGGPGLSTAPQFSLIGM